MVTDTVTGVDKGTDMDMDTSPDKTWIEADTLALIGRGTWT